MNAKENGLFNNAIRTLLLHIIFVSLVAFTIKNDFDFFVFEYNDSGEYYSVSGNPNALWFYGFLKFGLIIGSYYLLHCLFVKFNQNTNWEKYKLISAIFGIYLMCLFFAFPGIWFNSDHDEFQMFAFAKHLQIQYHQGTIMSIFYILSLMVFPAPFTVVLMQALLGSIILGDAVSTIYEKQHSAGLFAAVFFVSPCLIYFMLYPMRAFLTSVFLVGAFMELYKMQSKGIWNCKHITRFVFFLSIVVNLRIEMMVLIAFTPICLWLLMNQNVKRKVVIIGMIMVLLLISVGFTKLLDRFGNHSNSIAHNMLSFTAPVADILVSDPNSLSKEETDIIKQFFDVDRMVIEHKDKKNYKNYYYEIINKPSLVNTVSIKDYRKAQAIIFKLILRHPGIYLKNKLKLAYHTMGLSNDRIPLFLYPEIILPVEISGYFNQINPTLSLMFKKTICGDFYIGRIRGSMLFYPMWLPFLLSFGIFVLSIYRGKLFYGLVSFALLGLYLIVFTTAMETINMYYLPEFVLGVLIVPIFLIDNKEK